MKLLVISHKETWPYPGSPSGYATIGGFPFQMAVLSELFDSTKLLVLERQTTLPAGVRNLVGNQLSVKTMPEPKGINLQRKLNIMLWLPRHLSTIWKLVKDADVVHTPIPGDLGTIGLLIALLQRKLIFIRHCGRWGIPSSRFDKLLQWFLEKIASEKIVVFATGGSELLPSPKNPHIKWIFSSSLYEAELENLPVSSVWQPGQQLRLVTVGSLNPGKNISALIASLPSIRKTYSDLKLTIVGAGRLLADLQGKASENDVASFVEFVGNVSHQGVISILAESHIFVFPTLYEGFPKALLEAMAVGLPIIANPVSVIPYLLKDNAGYLLDQPTPEAIAVSVIKLISDPQAMREMGNRAKIIAKKYTLEAWRDQIKDRLESAWGVPLQSGSIDHLS